MATGDETADSYKTTAELLLRKKGEREKVIESLFKAAVLYGSDRQKKAIECLDELHNILKGSTTEFGIVQYYRYLHRLARLYEELNTPSVSADVYAELAREIYKSKNSLEDDRTYTDIEIFKKFTAYLAKALMLYDSTEKYDSILKLARAYYKVFPSLQQYKTIHGELFFCYEHIIHAADTTGSRYFREYYAGLDRELRGIELEYEQKEIVEGKGPYTQ